MMGRKKNNIWLSQLMQKKYLTKFNTLLWKKITPKVKTRKKLPQYNKSLTKAEIQTICYGIDEPWWCYAKWNKPVIQTQILYDSTYMKYLLRELKFKGTERRIVVARGWQRGRVTVWWSRIPVWRDERSKRWMLVMAAPHVNVCSVTELNTDSQCG